MPLFSSSGDMHPIESLVISGAYPQVLDKLVAVLIEPHIQARHFLTSISYRKILQLLNQKSLSIFSSPPLSSCADLST